MNVLEYVSALAPGDIVSGVHAGNVSARHPPLSTGVILAVDGQHGFFEVLIEGEKVVEIWYEDVVLPAG